MTLLYDRSGKEYKVPYSIDAKAWVATGDYFYDNPKSKGKAKEDAQKNIDLI